MSAALRVAVVGSGPAGFYAAGALLAADIPVEVSPGRYLLDPRTFAKLLELADVRPEDKVRRWCRFSIKRR